MALFGKKSTEPEAQVAVEVKAGTPKLAAPHSVKSVLVKPYITEKAALLTDKNVYVFEIKKGATKYDVRDAVKELYKVTPVSIRIVNRQPRHFMSRMRGRDVMVHGLRKAYVYLKKGDRIELV